MVDGGAGGLDLPAEFVRLNEADRAWLDGLPDLLDETRRLLEQIDTGAASLDSERHAARDAEMAFQAAARTLTKGRTEAAARLARAIETELPPLRLAFIRHIGPYTQAHRAWPKLLWWAYRRGRLNRHTQFYGLNYDDEGVVPEELQRYDAAIVLGKGRPSSFNTHHASHSGH